MTSRATLAETGRCLLAGDASPQELLEVLLQAQVFCEAPERPGWCPRTPHALLLRTPFERPLRFYVDTGHLEPFAL